MNTTKYGTYWGKKEKRKRKKVWKTMICEKMWRIFGDNIMEELMENFWGQNYGRTYSETYGEFMGKHYWEIIIGNNPSRQFKGWENLSKITFSPIKPLKI
jgi:hypothetical protein